MKKLRCKMLGGDWFLDQLKGLTVTVTEVDLRCNPTGGGYRCTVVVDGEMTAEQKRLLDEGGEIRSVFTDSLEPLDTSMVPESHCGNLMLKRVWVFAEARNDAWFRGKPRDLAKYEEDTGHPWTDERVFDVGMRRQE